jgi:hypothetical protein
MTYGPVDPNATDFRYSSLEAMKQRLGIEAADTSWDAQLTEAGVAAEVAIDLHLGRSFPDIEPDPVITIVPAAIKQTALSASVAIYQAASSPYGVQGSDAWALGTVAVPEIVRAEIQRNPMLVGFQVEWGIA